MQIPIPDDWDGVSWQCAQVEFPDSPLWTAILLGLLSYATRARVWDGDSGSILDAQAVGREIWERNFPLVPCAECDTETEPGGNNTGTEPLEITGDLCMNGCSIPYGALRWYGGKLQFRYCGEWYDVGGAPVIDLPISPDDDTDPYIPPEIDGGGYSACGKAQAVMDMVYGVVTSILDEVGNFSWEWWGHVKADNPGVGMDAKWIIVACEGAVNQAAADAAAGPSYDPDALDESTWQSVKCLLAQMFSDTLPEPMDGNEIRSTLQNLFASEWGVDVLTNAIFVDALRGINRESFEQAVILGASYADADCDCPAEPEALPPSIWFTSISDVVPETGTVWEVTEILNSGRRAHITVAHVASTVGRSTGSAHLNLAGYTAGDNIRVRVYFGAGQDELYNEWFDTCPQPSSEYCDLGFNGVDAGTRSNQSNYYEFETNNAGTQVLNFIDFIGGRWCPHYNGPFARTDVYVEIVAINGVSFAPLGPE